VRWDGTLDSSMAAVGLLGENHRESRWEMGDGIWEIQEPRMENRVWLPDCRRIGLRPCQRHIKTASVIIINYALIAFSLESLRIAWNRLVSLGIAGGSC